MKAIVINEFGDADVLRMAEVEKPVPVGSQVLIKVKAIGINPVDTKVRAGGHLISKRLKFPAILGWDISGIVQECGSEVIAFRPGDAVFGNLGFPNLAGGYAEYVLADANEIVAKPSGVSFEEAAALPVVGLTAYQAIHDYLKLQDGQTVLIQAAAGGVGHISVQLAKLAGATVFGTASTSNEEFVRSLGADHFIDYTREDFEKVVHRADAAQDAMGGDILYRSIRCLRPGGRIVCLPSSTKNDPEAIALAKDQGIELVWPMMYKSSEQLEVLVHLMDQKKLKIRVSKIFPFNEMSDAHRQIESHHTAGKVVVRIE